MKEDIVMQEEENSIKNGYLPTNMTANVNVEEVKVQILINIWILGGNKAVQLNIGADI